MILTKILEIARVIKGEGDILIRDTATSKVHHDQVVAIPNSKLVSHTDSVVQALTVATLNHETNG